MHARSLSRHTLDHHSDCHTRREAVGVEHDVGDQPRLREGQVFGRPALGADTLLAGPGSELVAHCGVTLEEYKKGLANKRRTHTIVNKHVSTCY